MKTSLPVIGVTGGIGSGKSVVCKVFEVLGALTYYADDRAKWLMENDEVLVSQIVSLFGNQSYIDGKLDRKHVGAMAFHDDTLLGKLNALVHPAVKKDVERWTKQNVHAPLLLKEAALLFETGSYKELRKTILVTAPRKLRIDRVLNRDSHRDKKDVQAIISKQMSEEEKLPLADYVITNDGTQSVISQVCKLYDELVIA